MKDFKSIYYTYFMSGLLEIYVTVKLGLHEVVEVAKLY